MCPKCGGCEFEIVTVDSVLQRITVNGDSQVHWDEPVTLAVLKIMELRCLTCGVDLLHNEVAKRSLTQKLEGGPLV